MLGPDLPVVDDEHAAAVLRQAIIALQADEIEDAAVLLPAVEAFVRRGAGAGDPGVARLMQLWRDACDEADASSVRLRERLQKQVASQRMARAYRGP